jgi:ABC-type nitrate/sulfonate/bicarbonate transport system substrate-binding protein
MQILKGSKREVTLFQWNEQLEKARKRLSDSKKCQELYGDHEHWIEEDEKKVQEIENSIEKVIAYMDKHNIK